MYCTTTRMYRKGAPLLHCYVANYCQIKLRDRFQYVVIVQKRMTFISNCGHVIHPQLNKSKQNHFLLYRMWSKAEHGIKH